MSDFQGIVSTVETVVSNVMRDPVGAFLAALEPGTWPIRDAALANGLVRPQVDSENNKIVWHEGATGQTSLSLNTAISADSTTTFDFGTTAILGVVPNMLISFETEIVRVISVDTAAGTCVVERGFSSTDALASIATSVVGTVLSVTPTEVEDAGESTAAYGAAKTNYLHYFEEVYKVSDKTIGQLMQMQTPEFEIAYQINDKFKKMGRQLAYALWRSVASSTGNYRTMDGFRAQIKAAGNESASVGDLLFSDIDAAAEDALNNGIQVDTLFVPPTLKRQMAPWAASRLKTVVNGDPRTAGGSLNTFETATGQILNIEPDSSLLDSDILICRKADLHAGFVPILPVDAAASAGLPQMTGVRAEFLGKTGAHRKVQCLSYATSQFTNAVGAWLLSGVSGVDADGVA